MNEKKTIDVTPKWEGLLPALLILWSTGLTAKTRQDAKEELKNMARAADRYNELQKNRRGEQG